MATTNDDITSVALDLQEEAFAHPNGDSLYRIRSEGRYSSEVSIYGHRLDVVLEKLVRRVNQYLLQKRSGMYIIPGSESRDPLVMGCTISSALLVAHKEMAVAENVSELFFQRIKKNLDACGQTPIKVHRISQSLIPDGIVVSVALTTARLVRGIDAWYNLVLSHLRVSVKLVRTLASRSPERTSMMVSSWLHMDVMDEEYYLQGQQLSDALMSGTGEFHLCTSLHPVLVPPGETLPEWIRTSHITAGRPHSLRDLFLDGERWGLRSLSSSSSSRTATFEFCEFSESFWATTSRNLTPEELYLIGRGTEHPERSSNRRFHPKTKVIYFVTGNGVVISCHRLRPIPWHTPGNVERTYFVNARVGVFVDTTFDTAQPTLLTSDF